MTIIAAVDRTDRAKRVIEEAGKIAEAFDEEIHVVHVVSETEFIEMERTSVEERGRPIEPDRIVEVAQKQAERAAESYEDEVTTVGLYGKIDAQIINYANDHDAHYIVVAPRKRSPTGKALFGSVAQGVILNADCPVVSTPSTQ